MTLELAAAIDVGDITVTCELSVESGETVAIVGPNGAGKSTVLRAIAGLAPVRSGHVRFDGDAWDEPATGAFVAPESRSVGMVFQRYLLFDHLSVRDNVAFGLRARGQRSSDARRSADAVLTRLGLTTLADRRPPTLSGGQAQRVALARALAIEPGVVLLDEPLAAIDVAARPQLRAELAASLARTDVCRVLVTHDPVDAYALADRVVVLEHGMVTQRGPLAELAVAPRTAFVADLLGTNLLRGTVRDHRFEVATGGERAPFEIAVGPHDIADGDALASIRPQSISLHRSQPEGSPRNVWQVTVSDIEHGADRVRVRLDIGLVAELTPAGAAAMHIARGDQVWVSLKASEVALTSA